MLWDSDPELFGAPYDRNRNGTHVDMLHETPYCMGIAHERDNVYWAFNGDVGALDRYDFNEPHEPGGEDHADGYVWRYAEGELARVPEVPSHLAYDARRRLVFAADTGHGRVVALDATSGFADGDVIDYDGLETNARMSGARLTEVVAPGILEMPSGVAFHEGVLFATDHATGKILALLPSGEILRELDTGLAAEFPRRNRHRPRRKGLRHRPFHASRAADRRVDRLSEFGGMRAPSWLVPSIPIASFCTSRERTAPA